MATISRAQKLSLEQKLTQSPHFRALMESYRRYVERHGMSLEEKDEEGAKEEL